MLRTTLRTLWSHKRRLISTALAVLLGVAFMTGTLVLSGTMDKAFDDLFADANQGVDTVVRGPEVFRSQTGGGTLRARFPIDTLEAVEALDGVEVVEPYIFSFSGAMLTKTGDALGGQGPPTLFESWTDDGTLNSFDVVDGRAPEAPGEIVVNRTAVEDGEYAVGDNVTLITSQGREEFELVGVTAYGDAGSQAGVISVGMTLSEAQRLAGAQPTEIDNLLVAGDGSVSDVALTERIQGALPDGISAVTGAEAAQEISDAISEGFGFLSQLLLVFAGIALFVGTFIISNTFSILLAQRTRELALLRAIGAGRGQVLGSVLAEALIIGIVAAAFGLVIGVGLAFAALAALSSIGLELPSEGLVVSPQTILSAVVVGLVVTVGAAILPAVRATRVPPIAALRDVAIDRSSRSWLRGGAAVLLVIFAVIQVRPAFGDDIDRDALLPIGIGAVALLLAVLAAGPLIAKPLTRVLGGWLPAVRGITGRLASENARRNPGRTSSTAAALAIGITLVGFITIFGASTRAAITSDVERGFRGDFIVQQPNSFGIGGVSPVLAEELSAVEGVDTATGFKQGEAQVNLQDGAEIGAFLGAVDPAEYQKVFDVRMDRGSLADLREGTIIVDRQMAADHGLAIGDQLGILFPTGKEAVFTVSAIGADPTLLGDWTVNAADYVANTAEPVDFLVAIALDEGVDPEELRPTLRRVVDGYPTVALQDRDQFIGSLVALINQFLVIIYALLGLSVVIALIGIANTLSLSIYERTRELGLLRAVGMTRGQLKSTVRWEAVVVALIGTVLGLSLSIAISWLVVRGLSGYGLGTYEIPWSQMVAVVLFGAGLGIIAALRPAKRAAKLDVLEAIASE